MSWTVSRFRAGDVVEVRSREEILATLNPDGTLDGMPFMPEMLKYCGQRFTVDAVAHKTCDTVKKTGGRRVETTVHLKELRCDGSAHGGCQAACYLFFKDAWLKPAGEASAPARTAGTGCTMAQLTASTQIAPVNGEPRYACQATKLVEYTTLLPWWSPRQYLLDITTKNHGLGRVAKGLWLSWIRAMVRHTPVGYRALHGFSDAVHRSMTGRATPDVTGKVPAGQKTPTGHLDLKPGDMVRIKPEAEIEATLDEAGRNRGMSFDTEEMGQFCGKTVKVKSIVTQIIEEQTGKMIQMKSPCIMLEGVYCKAENAQRRLNCPRAIPSYWRAIWLEKK